MALRRIFQTDLRNPYQKFNKAAQRVSVREILFGEPIYTSAEDIEFNLRNELDSIGDNPDTAKNILENAIRGKGIEPQHRQALFNAGLSDRELSLIRTEDQLFQRERDLTTAVAVAAGSFAFRAGLRVLGNAAANQAVTSGKVVQFEAQQRNFNNLKRAVGFGGSVAGLSFGIVTSSGTFGVGAVLAIASQALNLYVENDQISAKQTRQDSNAQYYQEAFGGIVRRGNR